MYKPKLKPSPVPVIPPSKLNYPFIRFTRCFAVPIQHIFGFRKISVMTPEKLVTLYKDFQEGKIRLILGFRHSYGNDPQLMVFLLHCVLPKLAKKTGTSIRGFPHAHFIYGAEVPLWSGLLVRKILPQVGGLPVNHLKPDSKGINNIRKVITGGTFPTAIAPEGHVNFDSLNPSPLETGTARFSFWAEEDLKKSGGNAGVIFLPLSIHYLYSKNGKEEKLKKKLMKVLRKLEKECGITSETAGDDSVRDANAEPLFRRKLSKLEYTIRKIYTEELDGIRTEKEEDVKTAEELSFQIIERAEGILGIQNTGINAPEDFRMRIYAARQKAWDRMLSDEFKNLPPLAKSLAARKSGEAWYAMRYVETAELILHINQNEIPEKAPLSIFIEKTENIADLLERTKGGTLKNRPKLFPVYPLVIPGDPIPVSGYMPLYEKDKKKAVEELTGVYFNSFKSLAERFLESQKHDRPE